MTDTPTEEKDIAIPANIGVRCPKKGFKYRPARRCEGCEFFQGLNIRMQKDKEEMPFDQKYEVNCAFPIGRQLFEFDFTEE